MTAQLGLFDQEPGPRPKPTAPYQRGSETSREAAKSIEKHLDHLAGLVFALIRQHHDLTYDEAMELLEDDIPPQTMSARFRALADTCQVCHGTIKAKYARKRCVCRAPFPYIVKSGRASPTRRGRRAAAWRAA